MKQINIKIILLMLVLSSNIAFAQFGGGRGTAQSPYQIRAREHIEELADSIRSKGATNFTFKKYFKLMNDITDSVRCVIGEANHYDYISDVYIYTDMFHSATFDGQGHKITLAIVSEGNASLFGVTYRATIKNLRVDGYVKKNGNNGVRDFVREHGGLYAAAGIVGFAFNTEISNCVNYANIYINANGYISIGGIVGFMAKMDNYTSDLCSVSDCINFGNIEIPDIENSNYDRAVGGIAGEMHPIYIHPMYMPNILPTPITNCINFGTLKYRFLIPHIYDHPDNPGLGGILGKYIYSDFTTYAYRDPIIDSIYGDHTMSPLTLSTPEIENCINVGFIDGPGGGIVGTLSKDKDAFLSGGEITNKLRIKNCINAGFITGSGGGIVGGTTSSYPLRGGLTNQLTIENCINTGVLGNKPTNSGIANIEK